MKYEVVPESCRVCLRKYKKLRSIYTPLEEGDEPPNEMLKLITGISIEKEADAGQLPNNICKGCELSLNLAFQFRCKALKSQKIIETFCNQSLKILKDEFESMDVVKQEDSSLDILEVVEEHLEENINSSDEMKMEDLEVPFSDDAKIEFLDNDEEIYEELDVEYSSTDEEPLSTLEHQDPKEKVLKDINSSELDIFYPGPIDKTNKMEKELNSFDVLFGSKLEDTKDPVTLKRLDRHKKIDVNCKRGRKTQNNTADSDNCEITEDSNIVPDTATMKKTGRPKNTNECGYICDICGNIYAKRGRMTEHRRRHDKELRFACELCDKRFSHREKLRKHMFSHSGGKPFQCSFCSRTFFYESVKKVHEAIHKGAKPYACEICNKAFAYSHALKKHKLIHADIKLYHCEYCDKDFRLQHHMKQHEETKMHQNAVKSFESARMSN